MLDSDTKRRIDTCRDILVGKVPDPKSQVEQITIALIYKFMDDMDMQAKELGGKRSFFINGFEQYAWTKLMAPSLGGADMLKLYSEAIGKMTENTHLPELFRDIFKNAYLPYRDPETLKSFLKEINAFTYDHSEKLGDAFEYLLSVLGSQGDAGQFRTPRHIIDFVVEILKPQKHEVVLDPACGTAGFLISAYKHILNTNTTKLPSPGSGRGAGGEGHSTKPGNTLTPAERKKLAQNFKGYDISPDMVRLSLVNLYLHGFKEPHIFEYDTLTSDDRWNEYADVILANPPFMSPKGGIKPHKRFSVQSKRSEVLFVDYMAEHLSPTGRAGIIVPEGIIFQSQGSYVELRKLLVEQSLVAVISLPAGVFNPYSGVKTSILILDKQLAKKASSIAFFKVENDGFGLGAQRRAIDKNDLPTVQAELEAYLQSLRAGVESPALTTGHIVPKEKLAANGDYNLSGERYREGVSHSKHFPMMAIGDVCSTASGGTPKSGHAAFYDGGTVPWLRSGEVAQGEIYRSEMYITEEGLKNSSAKVFSVDTVLVAMYGATAGEVGVLKFEAATNQAVCGITPDDRLLPEFLYLILKANKGSLVRLAGGGAQPNISQKIIRDFKVPVPPLEVQKEIVAEIEGYQKVISGARAVIDNYRPHIPIHPDWPTIDLGDACQVIMTGPFGTALHQSDYVDAGIPVINPQNIVDGKINLHGVKMVSEDTRNRLKEFAVQEGDIVIGRRGEMGRCAVVTPNMTGWLCGTGCFVIRLKASCLARFAHYQITSLRVKAYLEEQAVGVTMMNLNQGILSSIQLYVPGLPEQQAIVAEIEAEQALVAANRELITRFEKKIQATLARVWGDAS